MPSFSEQSRYFLNTCDPVLQRLFIEVVRVFDCSVLCGHRSEIEQNESFKRGASTKKFPDSTHNEVPSKGIDVVPWPIVWPNKNLRPESYAKDLGRFYLFDGYVLGIASQMEIEIISGADWDKDYNIDDQNFDDLPHFQLIT